jgi:hypothetical protein
MPKFRETCLNDIIEMLKVYLSVFVMVFGGGYSVRPIGQDLAFTALEDSRLLWLIS